MAANALSVGRVLGLPHGLCRSLPASRPARGPGDVSGILIDSADPVVRRVWTFPCDRAAGAAIWQPTPAEGSTATRHRSKLARAYVCRSATTIHKTRPQRCLLDAGDAVALTTGRYGHNTAILEAINSISWLHDCRHSSLVVPCTGEALQECRVQHRRCGRRVQGATRCRRGRRQPCAPAPTTSCGLCSRSS